MTERWYVFDLEGDRLTLPDEINGTDYYIQIDEAATGRVATEFRIFKGPGEVQWHYYQSSIGTVGGAGGEWRPYFMPEGKYRAVVIW